MDNIQTDSPTVRKSSLKILFALAVQYVWKIKTADVTFAFLQSNPLVGMLALHVDDALFVGGARFDQDIIRPMMQRFKFGKIVVDEYITLGWNIQHDNGNINVSH